MRCDGGLGRPGLSGVLRQHSARMYTRTRPHPHAPTHTHSTQACNAYQIVCIRTCALLAVTHTHNKHVALSSPVAPAGVLQAAPSECQRHPGFVAYSLTCRNEHAWRVLCACVLQVATYHYLMANLEAELGEAGFTLGGCRCLQEMIDPVFACHLFACRDSSWQPSACCTAAVHMSSDDAFVHSCR